MSWTHVFERMEKQAAIETGNSNVNLSNKHLTWLETKQEDRAWQYAQGVWRRKTNSSNETKWKAENPSECSGFPWINISIINLFIFYTFFPYSEDVLTSG